MKNILIISLLLLSVFALATNIQAQNSFSPNQEGQGEGYRKLDEDYKKEFINVNKLIPSAIFDLKFATRDNFLQKPADGYEKPICFLTKKAAFALKRIQDELMLDNKTLKIYDCYRPLRAVKEFQTWANAPETPEDREISIKYFPGLSKSDLFPRGHLSQKPGNSRGSTVDLTIVDKNIKNYPTDYTDCRSPRLLSKELYMGTKFPCFHSLSHTDSKKVSANARQNRKFLKKLMKRYGFRNYYREWWHYTYNNEPHRYRFFDFPIN